MEYITIDKQINELTKESWGFHYMDGKIYLNTYQLSKKESTKHRKYEILKKYDRIQSRDNNISEEEIELSDELKQEVLTKFIEGIKVLKWSER